MASRGTIHHNIQFMAPTDAFCRDEANDDGNTSYKPIDFVTDVTASFLFVVLEIDIFQGSASFQSQINMGR